MMHLLTPEMLTLVTTILLINVLLLSPFDSFQRTYFPPQYYDAFLLSGGKKLGDYVQHFLRVRFIPFAVQVVQLLQLLFDAF